MHEMRRRSVPFLEQLICDHGKKLADCEWCDCE